MNRGRIKWLLAAPLLLLLCPPARAQATTEFLPEVDTNFRLGSDVRLIFQAKATREAGDPTQAEIGPSIEFFFKPLLKLHELAKFELDRSKTRPLVLAVGYRYVPSPGNPTVNRFEPVLTSHFPMKGGLLITDRNRADLDWSDGKFVWRYRNRITFERRFAIRSYHPAPYVSAEAFYQSKYAKWSSTALYVGCLLPVRKHLEFDPYYEHENNTGKSPNQQINAIGLILNFYL
jgi:hypothetical protein